MRTQPLFEFISRCNVNSSCRGGTDTPVGALMATHPVQDIKVPPSKQLPATKCANAISQRMRR